VCDGKSVRARTGALLLLQLPREGWWGGRKTTGARQPATAGRWLARGGAVPRDSNIHAAESPPAKDARLFSFFFFLLFSLFSKDFRKRTLFGKISTNRP
jgi:hypothetical protein